MTHMPKLTEKEYELIAARINLRSGQEAALELTAKPLDVQRKIFMLLTPTVALEAFDYLSPKLQKPLLESLPASFIAQLLEAMPPDDRTNLLKSLPHKTVDEYIKLLPDEDRKLTMTLLGYPEETVGHFMTTDYIAVKMSWTVEKVLEHIRQYGHDSETINVLFVVDDAGRLVDDVRIRELLFVPKTCKVSQVTDGRFIALYANDTAEDAINIFKEHDRVALPVVDREGKLLGIVTIDDILRLAAQETTEDIQKMGGSDALEEPYMDTPFIDLMKKRAKWLVILFIGELFTATAMSFLKRR